MTEKKEFCCDHCGATIEVSSPDDVHTTLDLKPIDNNIELKIECPECEAENVRYWRQAGTHAYVSQAR
jgi:hypothetical protein